MLNHCNCQENKTILVTGATGFLGRMISRTLCGQGYQVIGIGRSNCQNQKLVENFEYIKADILDEKILSTICDDKQPDVIVHCAGIAHQKPFRPLPDIMYEKINCTATKNLAKIAGETNPNIYFIFLSSICVYGEHGDNMFHETDQCRPTSAYAKSKLTAEAELEALFESGYIRKLDILRLSPVYDVNWRINLEKRICAPGKRFYLKYGPGRQKLSVLARKNLADFIRYQIDTDNLTKTCRTMNISDLCPSSFAEMICIMNSKSAGLKKPVYTIPLKLINAAALIAGFCFPSKKKFIFSCHDKLVRDIVINNQQMLNTGFKPEYTLKNILETK